VLSEKKFWTVQKTITPLPPPPLQVKWAVPTKIRIFFSATLGIRIFFLEKKHKNFNVLFVTELGRSKKIMIIWNQRIVKKGPNKKLSVRCREGSITSNVLLFQQHHIDKAGSQQYFLSKDAGLKSCNAYEV
jgi:hypothetical protein